MNFIKDKKTGIIYRPITIEDYTHIAYDSGDGHPAVYKLTKTDDIDFVEKHKFNDRPDLVKNNWLEIHVMGSFLLKVNSISGFVEVEIKSVPAKFHKEIFTIYAEPQWFKNLDKKVKDAWDSIVPNL
jgi:hypothetical protein